MIEAEWPDLAWKLPPKRSRALKLPDGRFYLVSAKKSRDSGHWGEDDYDVRDGAPDGLVVGRIMKVPVPQATPWFWGINLGPMAPHSIYDRGYALTREEAMAAFRAGWTARSSAG